MSQNNDYFLIECISDVNICIKRPLQQTLRIKFNTFDVSVNYLVFGATSGGIYVFSRSNYEFLKLVPTKEGAIVKLVICPEEKYIIVATSKGFIVLVENCFAETKIRYQLFADHEGNTITDLIWHYNEIYCGDNKGKVSVISLNSLLSKAIFQTPTATLMHLDAAVFQLDACGKFLLVSTKTKTFLCDTEEEHYRQIGKKLRDGDFGACFCAEKPELFIKNFDKEKSRFKILKEDETFAGLSSAATSGFKNAKIFCSRPGYRLWEANFEASVLCTYQFKTALHENQTESICLDSADANSHLKTRKMQVHHFDNFGRLQLVQKKFLITHCNNNLVVFDIQGINVLFIYEMRDIKDIRIVQNHLYVWNKKDMRIIALMDLEILVLKVLSSKQYVLCTELCLKYKDKLLQLLEFSDRLMSLGILKNKDRSNESNGLNEIFTVIERNRKELTLTASNKETKNNQVGIVKVENGHVDQPSCSYKHINNCNTSNKTIKTNASSVNSNYSTSDVSSNNGEHFTVTNEPMKDINYINNILYKQYQVNQLYNNIETPQLYELLSSKENLDDIVGLFDGFMKHVIDNGLEAADNNNVRHWCHSQYLKYVNNHRDCVKTLDIDSIALKYIFEAFKSTINDSTKRIECECKFPLPLNASDTTEYFHLAKDVYYKLTLGDREQLVLNMPLLWKLKIAELKDPLALLMQLGDVALFKEQAELFSYDQWDDCVMLLVKLKRGFCLNCDRRIDVRHLSGVITWKEFALIMLKRIGGLETTKVLKKYSKYIPNVELGYDFYQSCLFSAVSKENGKSCDFMANVLTTTRLENQFEDGLKEYLSQKYLGIKESSDFVTGDKALKCSLCHLLVKNPILDVSMRLSCGHLFHKLCLESINGICAICVQVPT